MSEPRLRRLLALAGLLLTLALATWWLGSTRLVLDRGGDTARVAADALSATWLLRAMGLALVAPALGALRGARQAGAAALALLAPAWPLVVLAWSASALAALRPALTEASLVAVALALPWLGQALRRGLPRGDLALPLASAAGVAGAAALWAARSGWLPA
ncbi:hypothetical protein BurJ1DRAFT_1474 [Burkholderiales bacterium JOSHI_001]|nr:hypothetical protein BurJ1DRAFT_1474 [Burkholderiales bacterium JOSHI_001]